MPVVFAAPPISLSVAHAFAAFFTVSYVGSLYLSKNARLSFKNDASPNVPDGRERMKGSDERWRNDPGVIRARLLAVSLSTVLSVFSVLLLLHRVVPESQTSTLTAVQSTLVHLGLYPDLSLQVVLPCLVSPVLYFGPLYAAFLEKTLPFQERWSFHTDFLPLISTWIGFRNYVMGPITEEIVFRSCMPVVYHLAGASRTKMIFLSPLAFGVAHLHHAWEIYNRFGRTKSALRIATMQTLFQLVYTSLFGFHCAFLFLRTGSLLPPTFSHIFCNIMGFPQYTYHVSMFPKRRLAIQAAYVLGVVGYIYMMRRWTLADHSLFWPAPGQVARY